MTDLQLGYPIDGCKADTSQSDNGRPRLRVEAIETINSEHYRTILTQANRFVVA